MEKWKKSVKRLLISVGIILLTILADFFIQDYIYKIKYKVVKDDFSHVFQIDSVEEIDNELALTGWVFKLDEDSISNDFEIILYDYNNDKEYYMDVEDVVREDVNEYFLCEYDYSNSGFVARIRASKLKLDKNNYEVLIRPKNVKKAFETDMYISNGKLMFTEPESFVALDVEGTGLEKIVNDGVLRVHRPDVGMYVYQYEGNLYWIADNNYIFEEDESTYIQYHLYTTQIENLPQHRLDNEWYWDNIGFYFEENENIVNKAYRVSMYRIPIEYSVEKILTGYYKNDTWQWRQYFRPWLDLNKC